MKKLTPFGEKLLLLGYSQASLADAVKSSRAAVHYWVNGRKMPQPDEMKRLTKELGLPVEEVVRLIRASTGKQRKLATA